MMQQTGTSLYRMKSLYCECCCQSTLDSAVSAKQKNISKQPIPELINCCTCGKVSLPGKRYFLAAGVKVKGVDPSWFLFLINWAKVLTFTEEVVSISCSEAVFNSFLYTGVHCKHDPLNTYIIVCGFCCFTVASTHKM